MIYDFRLYFTGLCLFHSPASEGEEGSAPVKVLLVNATDPDTHFSSMAKESRPHQHTPRLVVEPVFLQAADGARAADGLCVGPDGEDWALFDIAWQELSVEVPGLSGVVVPKGRKPSNGAPYSDPKQPGARPDWFDWTISIPSVGATKRAKVTRLKPACLQDPLNQKNPVATRLSLTGGRLETASHSRRNDRRAVYHYECLDGYPSLEQAHVFADRVVLRADGIPSEMPVRIKTPEKDILLKPADGDEERRVVRASITNLDLSYEIPREPLFDFLWFYQLYEWDPKKPPLDQIPIPTASSDVAPTYYTPSSTTCPPGGG